MEIFYSVDNELQRFGVLKVLIMSVKCLGTESISKQSDLNFIGQICRNKCLFKFHKFQQTRSINNF